MRLFVALAVPADVRELLDEAQQELRKRLVPAEVRWQDPERSHLTLRFLGEVAERNLPACHLAVNESARRSSPFTLSTAGIGAFPSLRRPSVLWLGVNGELDRLNQLQAAVSRSLDQLAVGGTNETFRPHLTLGRVRRLDSQSRGALTELHAIPRKVSWRVSSVQLLASELRPRGPRYTVLLDAPLGG